MTPTILLTNDDGMGAAGLEALRHALPRAWRLVVAAPSTPMSQCGHRITTHEPLVVTRRGKDVFEIDGTPADCVRLAVTQLLPGPPDWVIAGINHGGNLGADIYVSGTLAAVREGVFLGIPGIALSHFKKRHLEFNWLWAGACARAAIEDAMRLGLQPGDYWNINLPHLEEPDGRPEIVDCSPSKRPLPVSFASTPLGNSQTAYHYTGVYPEREREPGSDVDVCFSGRISRSRLSL